MLVALVNRRVVGFELRDQFAAGGGIGGGGDFGRGQREEFAFLELDAFPGRVADDAVEARFAVHIAPGQWPGAKYFGEPFAPIEAGRVFFRVMHEAVAVDDVARQRGERLARRGRANPERELRDLDGFGRKVDAVEIVVEDERGDLGCQVFVGQGALTPALSRREREVGEVADHFEVAVFQHVIRLE